jgi:hypothetical protein
VKSSTKPAIFVPPNQPLARMDAGDLGFLRGD